MPKPNIEQSGSFVFIDGAIWENGQRLNVEAAKASMRTRVEES